MHVGTFREKTCEIYNDQVDKAFDLRTIIDKGILNVRIYIYRFKQYVLRHWTLYILRCSTTSPHHCFIFI